MSKRFTWDEVKQATVDSDDSEATEIRGVWYKNQRYFSHSIFTVTVEDTVATIGYFKGEIDFKGAGKAHWSFVNSGDRGDLHCPTIHKIGNTPVLVVAEEWREGGGWNSRPYAELIIYSYNGAYALFEGVYIVKGNTFLLNKMLYEMGFGGEKTSDGYVHKRPTPKEEAKMSAKEAEEKHLYALAKKKERDEAKAAKFEEFKQLHDDGNLRLIVQAGRGYSPITGIRIPKPPEGTVYVFAWYAEGDDANTKVHTINHRLSKKHLKAIGLESVKAQNRWGSWFYAVDKEAVKATGFTSIDFKEYMMAHH